MKKNAVITLLLMLTLGLCACGNKAASQPDSEPSAKTEASDEDGEHISTFVKLTADERAAYEALGIGSVE